MMSSQKKIVAVVAVFIVVVAAMTVVVMSKKDSEDLSSYRYLYNYTYEDVDHVTKVDGTTLSYTAGGYKCTAIRVYTVAFKNQYTSTASISFSTLHMKTTITNPKDSSAETQAFEADYISQFFSNSSGRIVYAGCSDVIQVAFYLKDYSEYKTDKSKMSVDLTFTDSVQNYAKKTNSISVKDNGEFQFRTNPTTTTDTYTTVDHITLKDGSVKYAPSGFAYRVYAVNVRSTGDAFTLDLSSARLNLSVTYINEETSATTTKGYTATAEADYKLTSSPSLVEWTGNTTAYQTVYLAFLCPVVGSTVSSITVTAYMYFDGYLGGLVTSNSALPSPAAPVDP